MRFTRRFVIWSVAACGISHEALAQRHHCEPVVRDTFRLLEPPRPYRPDHDSVAYWACGVDQPAIVRVSSRSAYPPILKSANIDGTVEFLFVVGANGRFDSDSIRIVRSNNAQFTAAVKTAARRWMATAARVGGRPVPQYVEMTVLFRIVCPPSGSVEAVAARSVSGAPVVSIFVCA
jgi:TonB family protein